MMNPNVILQMARNELGYCRFDDELEGTKYGRWYAMVTKSPYYGESGVPYCCMFVSWVFAACNMNVPGLPEAYCPYAEKGMYDASLAISVQFAEGGDIVFFDWNDDGESDHVGIVESNHPQEGYMVTLEGNTTGADGRSGTVARRSRSYQTIKRTFRPRWEENDMPTPDEIAQAVWNFNLSGKRASQRLIEASDDATNTFDPTGRNKTMTSHDHIKYIGSEVANVKALAEQINDDIQELKSYVSEKATKEELASCSQRLDEIKEDINNLLTDSGKDGEMV